MVWATAMALPSSCSTSLLHESPLPSFSTYAPTITSYAPHMSYHRYCGPAIVHIILLPRHLCASILAHIVYALLLYADPCYLIVPRIKNRGQLMTVELSIHLRGPGEFYEESGLLRSLAWKTISRDLTSPTGESSGIGTFQGQAS